MSTFDNFMAMKVLYMLVTPIDKTEAFKLGVIDKDGTVLIKSKDRSSEQNDSFTYLDKLVLNLKKLIAKVPGGKTQLASFVAAMYLIKEHLNDDSEVLIEEFESTLATAQSTRLIEEDVVVEFFSSLYEEGEIANTTGPAVSTDVPTVKDITKNILARRKRKMPI